MLKQPYRIILSLGLLVCVSATKAEAAKHLGNGIYSLNGVDYTVEAWSYTNSIKSNTTEYYLLALPKVGNAPYPVIVFNNPYYVFPAPPSENPADIDWTVVVSQNPRPYRGDIYRDPPTSSHPDAQYYACTNQTDTWNPDACHMSSVYGLAGTDMHNNAQGGLAKSSSTVDWALSNGYAVAVTFTRFYNGYNLLTGFFVARDAVVNLKSDWRIDPNRIGMTGASGGAGSSVYGLSIPGYEVPVAAVVAVSTPIDWREIMNFAVTGLKGLQPASIYDLSWRFMATYLNVVIGTLGRNTASANYDYFTVAGAANRQQTPLLLISSTDDAMCPVGQSTGLHAALKAQGKDSSIWVHQNGAPQYASAPIYALAHGAGDWFSPVQGGFLARNYFLKKMPPTNVPPIIYRHDSANSPGSFNVIGILGEFRQSVCRDASALNKTNVAELIEQAANPIITYTSSDPRVPAGSGPTAIAGAINSVWSAEGVQWNATNVIGNLQAGNLPNCGQDVGAPSAPSNANIPSASQTDLILTWGASTDNVGVVGYSYDLATDNGFANIIRSSVDAGTALSVTITGLNPGTLYYARVRARDQAGNVSSNSNAAIGATQAAFVRCDLDKSGNTSASDVQLCVNQAIAFASCSTGDIDLDSACTVIDVQRVVVAALGGTCVSP